MERWSPKPSASELPESRDSDGDDLTRTGSGSEETGEEGLTEMQEELSSGEAKLSSSEQHEGTEPDSSLLEDDPSGSGASWQQEVKVDSVTTVYRTPRQPEGLAKTSKTKKIEKHSSRSKNKKASSTTSLSVNTTRLSDNQENQTVVDYETQNKEKVGIYAKGNQPLDEESGKTYVEVSLLSPSSTTVRSNTEDKYIPETTIWSLSNITPYYTKEAGEDQDANSNHYRGEENEENVYPTETQSPLKKTKSQKKSSRTSDQSSPASYKPSTNGIQKKSEVTETTLSINNRVNEPATEQEADSHLKEETDSTSYYYENVEDAQEEEEREEANLFPNELGEWSTLQPWGSGCSKPFYGSQFCTSIIMTTQLGHRDSECRGLRSYVSCLRALMDACEIFHYLRQYQAPSNTL
ncbi:hypothetical protein C0Q70_20991 [Pomacea canaliculata]|uniref:Uncharacterized protein n=1 Tax=Pomacea canaliculata TaxID=400727 RepID=A0A2T7NBB9_POMCA|nr:uncharacterized protein LOC112555549 [Pomacea canaliculata]PVD18442.1 hypothetical protein C0Q70_20991 [Pomacea canaliculata]